MAKDHEGTFKTYQRKPDPPKDVRIVVTGNTTNISWTIIIPTNPGRMYSRIYLKKSTDGDVRFDLGRQYKDIQFPTSSLQIPNLEMCSKYNVSIQYLNEVQKKIEHSDFTTHTFWVTTQRKEDSEVERFKLVNSTSSMPTLTIADIKKSDNGTYRCRIDHPYGNTYERTDITVNVQFSPKINDIWLFYDTSQRYRLNTTNTFSFSEDVNVSIVLRIESNPDPRVMFISSFLEMTKYPNTGNGYIDYLSILPHLKCEDSGGFTIRATNGIANGDTKSKPRNVTTEARKIETKVGSTENIVMYVVSYPLPTVDWCRVTWFNWSVKTDIYNYRYEIRSEIQVSSELDFGVYGIRICNLKGCIDDNITLKPRDKPEAPQNLFIESVTFGSVNLSWIAGFNGGYNQTFNVQFKTTDSDIWNTTSVHSNDIKTGSVLHVTLDQLKPDTSYEVMVCQLTFMETEMHRLNLKQKEVILEFCISLRALTSTNDHSEIVPGMERYVDMPTLKRASSTHEDNSLVHVVPETSNIRETPTDEGGLVNMAGLRNGK
ncbi:unnamed protein product [Mytilus edulis]|uniref:Uncharacterized protein n=1 Tax=Mytilus edulis TaxID=6550 RepID=A0A8S3SFY0_MYTED|nr:unnamed protein product [Mytilus edulis]